MCNRRQREDCVYADRSREEGGGRAGKGGGGLLSRNSNFIEINNVKKLIIIVSSKPYIDGTHLVEHAEVSVVGFFPPSDTLRLIASNTIAVNSAR